MRSCTVAARFSTVAVFCAPVLLLAASSAGAQVFIVQPEHVQQRYSRIAPTNIALSTEPINTLDREELIRFLQSERGYAMRPLPVGVLTLVANGSMEPSGDKYIDELHQKGICARAGDMLEITGIKFGEKEIVLDFNGGPYHRHRFLRHVAIGMGEAEVPLAQDNATIPSGTRIVLAFHSRIPDISGEQVEALLKPMVDFGAKSAAEAWSESLPPFLQKAVLEHRVLIGMDHDMVLHSKGEPIRKVRELGADGKPFEVWIYGEIPQPVEFVRFDGPFVVRDEVARVGEPMLVRTANELGNYWGNQPIAPPNVHLIQLGDRSAAQLSQESAPKAPPTLRAPGETLPVDSEKNKQPVMAPVNFPKDQQRPGDPNYTPPAPTQPATQPAGSSQSTTTTSSQPAIASQPATTSQPPPNPLDQAPSQPTANPQH